MIASVFDKAKSKTRSHHARVLIVNTDARLIKWLGDMFGGGISVSDRNREKNWKPRWQFQLSGRRAEEFIEAIRPYLRLKGEQADLVMRLKDVGRHRGGGKGQGAEPLSVDIWRQREDIKEEMHDLNRRGLKVVNG